MLLIDCHSDIVIDVFRRRQAGERAVLARRHLPRLRSGRVSAAVCTVGGDSPGLLPAGPSRAYEGALELLTALESDISEADGAIGIARSAREVRALCAEGRFAIVLALEGAMPLHGRLDRVAELCERGVRAVGLTWNGANALAAGIAGGHGGLTRLGAAAVELMAELGMIVDLAHASPRTIWETLALGTPGVIVSHANAAALHPHARNLDDDQAAAIAASGGFIGVCAYPGFVGPGDVTIEHVVDHIVHFVNNLGARHVGIGADFLDYLEEYRDIRFPAGLQDAGELGSLIEALSRRKLAPADIAEVAGNAFLRVLHDVAN
jgi:membrane dipeptidase